MMTQMEIMWVVAVDFLIDFGTANESCKSQVTYLLIYGGSSSWAQFICVDIPLEFSFLLIQERRVGEKYAHTASSQSSIFSVVPHTRARALGSGLHSDFTQPSTRDPRAMTRGGHVGTWHVHAGVWPYCFLLIAFLNCGCESESGGRPGGYFVFSRGILDGHFKKKMNLH